jgi:hypothetical protein
MMRVIAVSVLALAATPARAFWILDHGQLTLDRLDPIISPGAVSSHVHVAVGARAFGPIATNVSAQAAGCTTSPVQADKSMYWVPQLYHQNLNNGVRSSLRIDAQIEC